MGYGRMETLRSITESLHSGTNNPRTVMEVADHPIPGTEGHTDQQLEHLGQDTCTLKGPIDRYWSTSPWQL